MSNSINKTAIVLRLLPAKDADRVIYLLTQEGEKLVCFAKGIRKATSRKAHALDLLNLVKVKLIYGKAKLPVVTEAQLLTDFSHIKQNYAGLMFAQLACEVLATFAEENHQDQGIFQNALNLFVSAQSRRFDLLAAALILRILYNSGSLPKLNEDVYTGNTINPNTKRYLANPIGYTVQPRNTNSTEPVADRIIKVQRFIIKNDYRLIQKIDLLPLEALQLLQLHIEWLQNTTERELKTAHMFLQAIKNNNE